MATGGDSGSEEIDFRRTCILCMEPYVGRTPKILPCFHSFCLPCLAALEASVNSGAGDGSTAANTAQRKGMEGKVIYCPTCRAAVTVPAGGVASFQTNFYVDHESEEDKLCGKCETGKEEKALYTCQECQTALCSTCRLYHDKFMTKHHVAPLRSEKTLAEQDKEIKALKDEIARLKVGREDTLQSRTTSLESEVAMLGKTVQSLKSAEKAPKPSNVGFQVRRSGDPMQVTKNSPILFDVVITNLGQHYSPQTGLFIAPLSGLYSFHASCMADLKSSFCVTIMLDQVAVAQCWSTSRSSHELGSNHATVHVKAGQRVWARSDHTEKVRACFWTTFGGHLVSADSA